MLRHNAIVAVICTLAICQFMVTHTHAASPQQWKSRSIYQLLTDRFYNPSSSSSCGSLSDYCGGTFQGVIDKLDYIQGMGFDAIWISPVVENVPHGYHGFWAKNLYQVNSYFGSADDLRQLSQAVHARGMYLMVGVVANHMGITDYNNPQVYPFDQASYYHDCSGCDANCNIADFTNAYQVEHCRLSGLPDLDQSQQFVHDAFMTWVKQLVANYSIDGLRVDTVPEVKPAFWSDFTTASGVYTVGEVFNGDVNYVAPFQGPLSGVLSYPLFYTLRNVFQSKQSMTQISASRTSYSKFSNIDILGTFVDNHDNARFLNGQNDRILYENAIVYVLLSTGIPIVYYGSEQYYSGGNDPNCRETLWTSGFQNTSLYSTIAAVNGARSKFQVYNYPQIERFASDNFYAFSRGNLFVALNNQGSNAQQYLVQSISYHPYSEGEKICSLNFPGDCPIITNGKFSATIFSGHHNLYAPATSAEYAAFMQEHGHLHF